MSTISVIIVTYNAAATLQKCLNSIYSQTYADIKIIIIDGNSTDETIEIIRANEDKIFYWKSEADGGIYNAMNKALLHIKSEWVYFLGADDELYADFSAFAGELKDPSIIYYANVRTKGVIRSGKLNAYQMAKHGVFHQAIIYPAAVFKQYRYKEEYKIFADYVLNMELWQDKTYRFFYADYIIAHFNYNGSSGNIADLNFNKDKSGLILKNFGWMIWMRYQIKIVKSRRRLVKVLNLFPISNLRT